MKEGVGAEHRKGNFFKVGKSPPFRPLLVMVDLSFDRPISSRLAVLICIRGAAAGSSDASPDSPLPVMSGAVFDRCCRCIIKRKCRGQKYALQWFTVSVAAEGDTFAMYESGEMI